jgi:RNA polymerase sigma factor (sigma-70 family)
MNERRQDFELLQAFARHRDESAFAALVERHLTLVHGTARRKVEDPEAAEEISQNVFVALARKAWRFAPDDSLPAWLHRAALLEAQAWVRGELRRRRREQVASELGTTMKTPDPQNGLCALVPLLDEALLTLREKDRAALLLRYGGNRSLQEVGASLGVSEDAAQKRVASALDRLVRFFQRRGFRTASVAAAAGALQYHASAAPATLAAAITRAAARAAPTPMTGLTAGLARLASLTKVQKALVCLLLAGAPVLWHVHNLPPAAAMPAPPPAATPPPPPTLPLRLQARLPTFESQPAPIEPEPRVEPAPPWPPQKEYGVHIRALVNLPEFKAVLLGVQHHSLDRSNAPPMLVRRLLREGEVFDDRSIRGGQVTFEVMAVDMLHASVQLREDTLESVYELEGAAKAGFRPGGLNPTLWLPNPTLDDFVDLLAALIDRTVLCDPRWKGGQLSLAVAAGDRAEAVVILEKELDRHGISVLLEGERFALLVPNDRARSITAGLRYVPRRTFTAEEYIASGAIDVQADLSQVLPIYGELLGRKPINAQKWRGASICFRNQTALSRSEALYALDILLSWQNLQVVLVDDKQFSLRLFGSGR